MIRQRAWALLIAFAAVLPLVTVILGLGDAALADQHCVVDPELGRVDCSIGGGGGGSQPGGPGGPPTDEPLPLRYLRVGNEAGVGDCWYWARTPPGLDAWDPANDAAIITTRLALPQCPSRPGTPAEEASVEATAWEVFRSFPLAAPDPRLEPPDSGITGLPTYVSARIPDRINHAETLPAGLILRVEASVVRVTIDWGDGTRTRHDPEALQPHPAGTAVHSYTLKTCSAQYRAEHPSGPNCHPELAAYPVTVTYTWWGRYRYDGPWVDLGSLDRTTTVAYDVDEVVGVLQP